VFAHDFGLALSGQRVAQVLALAARQLLAPTLGLDDLVALLSTFGKSHGILATQALCQ